MGSKAKKSAQSKTRNANKSTKGRVKLAATKSAPPASAGPAEEQFVKGLLVRGEAAKPTPDGKLPLQATHVIETENKDGSAKVRRVRFKLF
jgi:hypothetical protein